MWLYAAETAGTGGDSQLIILIFGLLGSVVVTAGTVIVALINSRANRTTPSPPPANGSAQGSDVRALRDVVKDLSDDVGFLRDRVAKVEQRADDNDERDDVQDRRIELIERAKDHEHPGWRSR